MREKIKKAIPQTLQALAWAPTRFLLNYFIDLEVKGLTNLAGITGPIIFASNHISELDPILVRAALPCLSKQTPLFYVSRANYLDSVRGVRKYIYGGFFFKCWGAYPTTSGQKNYEVALQNHLRLLTEGNSVCIFPEGKISKTGELGEIHGGVAFLAQQTGIPIVPVFISGVHNITRKEFFTRKRKATVVFSPRVSIPRKKQGPEAYRDIAKSIMHDILPTT